MSDSIRISPNYFVHVLDQNKNITRLATGPKTLTLQCHERLVLGPIPMISVPPGCYCVVKDPVKKYIDGECCDLFLGQTKIKFHGECFPLYPGESLPRAENYLSKGVYTPAIQPLPIVKANHAIRLTALVDHLESGVKRIAGENWQLEGPLTYKPSPEAVIDCVVSPQIIKTGQVLKLRAKQELVDHLGRKRVTGEEWLIKDPGTYLPNVFEEIVSLENKITITADVALHLMATQTISDIKGQQRVAGEEWLVTSDDTCEYSPQVGVKLVNKVKKTVLKKGQYAVVVNPIDKNEKPQLGKKVLKIGLCSFFLYPGESLENNKIQNAHILSAEDSLVLLAVESFYDTFGEEKVKRHPGEKWLIKGPTEYIPPVHVQIIKQRKNIPLSKNEGIYVQDTRNGKVRLIMGPQSYMLSADEELWEKELGEEIETLLSHGGGYGSGEIRKMAYFEQSVDPSIVKGREKFRVVTYRCPSNTAVQVYNYQNKQARVVFGPDLVVLGPQENFNVLSLSAGKPKKENAMKSLCLMLGPDFITDIIEVETSDHARLRLQIAFNNYFEVDKEDNVSARKIFSIPDFIGFACRQIGSKIRANVALTTFDQFHRYSSNIIQAAVFGHDSLKSGDTRLKFDANNLVISSIDIQSIEPVDAKMRDSLTKSVQLAIEISTNSIEAAAKHEANTAEQKAKGQLESQILVTEKESERERARLYMLRAETAAVESTGQAKAEAQAQAERLIIECQSEIQAARLRAEASEIAHEMQLLTQEMFRTQELHYTKEKNSIETSKQKALATLEVRKFKEMVSSLGAKTIVSMANVGPESQVKLLRGLGLESVLITDGSNPINLFDTAKGLITDSKK